MRLCKNLGSPITNSYITNILYHHTSNHDSTPPSEIHFSDQTQFRSAESISQRSQRQLPTFQTLFINPIFPSNHLESRAFLRRVEAVWCHEIRLFRHVLDRYPKPRTVPISLRVLINVYEPYSGRFRDRWLGGGFCERPLETLCATGVALRVNKLTSVKARASTR